MDELGKLKKVPLRSIWVHEATKFTKWLAEEENLALLSDELDIEISLIETEATVGSFNVDILAEDPGSDKKIIIENQLEKTDHDHLGKIITYASGVAASHIIWIVADVREEHKRAIEWLNEHTDDEINFFLIKIELWQIEDSTPAPKFNVISEPNGWAKAVKQSTSTSNRITDTKLKQLEFWEKFREYAEAKKSKLSFRKPNPQHWYNISSGSSEWHIALTLNTSTNMMACEVYIRQNKDLYKKFEDRKDSIESHLGKDLEWMELPGKKASRIKQSRFFKLDETDKWNEYFEWLLYRAESFKKTFNDK